MTSGKTEDRLRVGVIVEEINHLSQAKSSGEAYRHEDRLNGDQLADIGYLRLYVHGMSARVYFTMHSGTLWMLALDVSKRATKISEGMTVRLKARLNDVRALAAKEAERKRAQSRGRRKEVRA